LSPGDENWKLDLNNTQEIRLLEDEDDAAPRELGAFADSDNDGHGLDSPGVPDSRPMEARPPPASLDAFSPLPTPDIGGLYRGLEREGPEPGYGRSWDELGEASPYRSMIPAELPRAPDETFERSELPEEVRKLPAFG
jgi:hypothetical protein